MDRIQETIYWKFSPKDGCSGLTNPWSASSVDCTMLGPASSPYRWTWAEIRGLETLTKGEYQSTMPLPIDDSLSRF
jgi:hypothetical protein